MSASPRCDISKPGADVPDITVIVAGADPAMRLKLMEAVKVMPGFRVVAQVADLPATYTVAEAMEPDMVLVARELTHLPEFSLMRSLFRAIETQWISVAHGGVISLPVPQAYGPDTAADFPTLDTDQSLEVICIRIAAAMQQIGAQRSVKPVLPNRGPDAIRPGKLILIGASTGGVDALLTVLSAMPADCPPIAVVQHTGQGFSESLIRLLDRRCAVTVEAARTGMELRPGHVCVAAGCRGHMRLRSSRPYRIVVEHGPPVSGHLPSVDALFHSAVKAGPNVVAALLTGMGRDGADGMLALRQAGAVTIGQNESSSVVYGMPRAAWELGAVRQQLPLEDIAEAILRACAQPVSDGRVAL